MNAWTGGRRSASVVGPNWLKTCRRRWVPASLTDIAVLPTRSWAGQAKRRYRSFPEVLRASVVRHSGWPPFWYPTRQGIEPYPFNGAVECWLGGDEVAVTGSDAAYSDFLADRS